MVLCPLVLLGAGLLLACTSVHAISDCAPAASMPRRNSGSLSCCCSSSDRSACKVNSRGQKQQVGVERKCFLIGSDGYCHCCHCFNLEPNCHGPTGMQIMTKSPQHCWTPDGTVSLLSLVQRVLHKVRSPACSSTHVARTAT